MDDKSTALPSYQDLPPAYTAPQENAATRRAPSSTAAAAAAAAAPPPPSYKPKRTPSQEEIYIRELKAWAAEKQKMNPGAYGEYFNTVSDSTRVPQDEWQHWHRARGEDERGGGSAEGGAASRHQRRRSDNGGLRRKDSVGEEGSSVPRDGFLKRRMSGFMKMMGRHDNEISDETTGGHNDDELEPAFAVADSRAELGTVLEPGSAKTP